MLFEYTIKKSSRKTIAIQVDKNCRITVRAPYSVSDEEIERFLSEKREWLQKAIISQRERAKKEKQYTDEEISVMRNKAKKIIPERVLYYSKIMGVSPTAVKINSAKTRYGSCSAKNSLNFSLYLMDKDERFIDYVVVHELAHIRHHNHSKAFYDFVEKFIPDYKRISKL